MIEKYYEMLSAEKKKIDNLEKRSGQLSFVRLIAFVLVVALLAVGVQKDNLLFTVAGIVMILVFIYLIGYHTKVSNELSLEKSNYTVIERYIKRIDGGWRDFEDNGEEFLDKNDHLSLDVDLLGKNSLYQLLCAAHTSEGRRLFSRTVSLGEIEGDIIIRNEAVNELAERQEMAIKFEGYSLNASGKRNNRASMYVDIERKKCPPFIMALLFLVPLLNITALVLFMANKVSIGILGLTFIFGLCTTFFSQSVTAGIMYPFFVYMNKSDDYYNMLKLFTDCSYDSFLLSKIKEDLTRDKGCIEGFKSLRRKGELFNLTNNAIIHFILNGFLGWDFILSSMAGGWSKKYEEGFVKGIGYVARIEELISLSVLNNVRETNKPVIEEGAAICAHEIRHPLLDVNKVVANSIDIKEKTIIITGSNMSGKTTFLRTLAINLALSYMGANVTADGFTAPYMKIFSSMRVSDDVANGISTFYAEILRIKSMAEYLGDDNNKLPAICFIDEIFKGTNSADRIVGAKKAIKKLSEKNAIVLVSTHDFELCRMDEENEMSVKNYHFEEHYEDDKLLFDYKIKDGECTTRNALHILKMAGL